MDNLTKSVLAMATRERKAAPQGGRMFPLALFFLWAPRNEAAPRSIRAAAADNATAVRILSAGSSDFKAIGNVGEPDAHAFEAQMNDRDAIIVDEVDDLGTSIIEAFDNERPASSPPINIEQHQRSLDIFSPSHNYNYIGNIRYLVVALGTIVVLSSLLVALWVTKERKTHTVVASQPIFLLLICFGTLLMGVGIYPLMIDDEIASVRGCDIACMVRPWLMGCGFSCAYSALFGKTLRINKLFGAAAFTRVTVTVMDVMKPVAGVLSLNIILLSVWTATNPLTWKRTQTSATSSYGSCQPQTFGGVNMVPVLLYGVLNFATLVAANIQAFRAREISDEFSESKYIGMALYSILQASITAPIASMTLAYPRVYAVIVSMFMFIVSMSLLILMFVPKVLMVRQKKKEAKMDDDNDEAIAGTFAVARGPARWLAREEINQHWYQDKERLRQLKSKLSEQGGIDDSTLTSLFIEAGFDLSESE